MVRPIPPFWPSLITYLVEHPWDQVTLEDMAHHVCVELRDFTFFFPDKASILEAFLDTIDQTTEQLEPLDSALLPQDRLFECVMARLDALSPYRRWVASFLHWKTCTPCEYARLGQRWLKSTRTLAQRATLNTKGPKGLACVAAVTGVYLYTLKQWADDTDPHMGATMAALNQGLSFISGCLEDA